MKDALQLVKNITVSYRRGAGRGMYSEVVSTGSAGTNKIGMQKPMHRCGQSLLCFTMETLYRQ